MKRPNAFTVGEIEYARPKTNDTEGSILIKAKTAFMPKEEIIEVTCNGETNQFTRNDCAVDNTKAVGIDFG
jgi:hypothetical protein